MVQFFYNAWAAVSCKSVCKSTGLDKKKISVKLKTFSYPLLLAYVAGAQKNSLIETVLLSTHNICFGWEIRKQFPVTHS